MPEHSPEPWHRAEDGEAYTIGIFWDSCPMITEGKSPVAACRNEEARERIIKSVNALRGLNPEHVGELVRSFGDLIHSLNAAATMAGQSGKYRDTINDARELLAKVKQ